MYGIEGTYWNGLFKLFVMKQQPIFITGVERSGCSIVARVISMTGGCFTGYMNGMYENWRLKNYLKTIPLSLAHQPPYPEVAAIPVNFQNKVMEVIHKQGYKDNKPWMFKSALMTPTWKIWNTHFPNAKWIIVHRDSKDIINSCMKTTYMRLMKDPVVLSAIGVDSPEAGWEWWIKKNRETWMEMIGSGLNCKVVRPDRMADGDYTQMKEIVEWLELPWNESTQKIIDPLINRR